MEFKNVSLRLLSIVVKFLSLAFISRGLSNAELDMYFLILSIAAVISQIFGLQTFHLSMKTFNKDGNKAIIDTQIYQHAITFTFLIFLTIIFHKPLTAHFTIYSWILILVVILEIIVVELSRFFIVIGRSLYSNIVACANSFNYLFFSLLVSFYPGYFDGLKFWWVTVVPTIFICLYLFLVVFRWESYTFFTKEISFKEVNQLVCRSYPYLVSQFFNLSIIYFSRFILERQKEELILAYYSILFSFANLVSVFITVGIIAPMAPAYLQKKNAQLRGMLVKTISYSLVMITMLYLSFSLLVDFVGKSGLLTYKLEFLMLLAGTAFMSISQVMQLYFLKSEDDIINLKSYGLCFIISITLSIYLVPKFHLLGASIAYFISSLGLLLARILYFKTSLKLT